MFTEGLDLELELELEVALEVIRGNGGEGEGLRARWVCRAERTEDVVLVKTCRASGGGFVACDQRRSSLSVLTWHVDI